MKTKFFISVEYSDDSEFSFNVEVDGTDSLIHAILMMITRGTLMASGAFKASCYDEKGCNVCAYYR